MTHLRKMMLEELQRRHYSEATTRRYIRFIERFAQHFHCSPDRLGPRHIREYQAQLFTMRKLAPGSVTVLHRSWPRRHEITRPHTALSAASERLAMCVSVTPRHLLPVPADAHFAHRLVFAPVRRLFVRRP